MDPQRVPQAARLLLVQKSLGLPLHSFSSCPTSLSSHVARQHIWQADLSALPYTHTLLCLKVSFMQCLDMQ